jgi:hypothetical protein
VTRRAFTFNGRRANVTAIDAATDEMVGTLPLPGKIDNKAYYQSDDVFARAGAAAEPIAYAAVEVQTPGGRVWTYGSVVDNATGDPTTIPVFVN